MPVGGCRSRAVFLWSADRFLSVVRVVPVSCQAWCPPRSMGASTPGAPLRVLSPALPAGLRLSCAHLSIGTERHRGVHRCGLYAYIYRALRIHIRVVCGLRSGGGV